MSEVIKARSKFDRQLARIAQMRVWELTPACLNFLESVLSDATQKTSDRIKACQIIVERTLPKVVQIDQRTLVAMLPAGEGAEMSDEQADRARFREGLKRLYSGQLNGSGHAH